MYFLTREQFVGDYNFYNDFANTDFGYSISSFDSNDSDKSADRGEDKVNGTCVPNWCKSKINFESLLSRTRKINPLDVFGKIKPIGAYDKNKHKDMIKTENHKK